MHNEILSNKTATPQTNFGLYNIGSEMLWDRATAIWSIKFLSETPCSPDFLESKEISEITVEETFRELLNEVF